MEYQGLATKYVEFRMSVLLNKHIFFKYGVINTLFQVPLMTGAGFGFKGKNV